MIGRRCHCGCRANLERCNVRPHAKYASRSCKSRAWKRQNTKAATLQPQSRILLGRCARNMTPPHSYASTPTRNSPTSLSGRKNPKQAPQFPQSGSRVAFSLSRTNVDLPENREPESLERQFVRWIYAEDCELPYVPASKEPRLPPRRTPQPPVNVVLGRLFSAGCEYRARGIDEWEAFCPTHDDARPSLVIRRNPNGSIWIKCWSGCSKEGILAALDLQWRDLWDNSEHDHGRADGPPVKRLLTPELRRAMERMLAEDDERRAS